MFNLSLSSPFSKHVNFLILVSQDACRLYRSFFSTNDEHLFISSHGTNTSGSRTAVVGEDFQSSHVCVVDAVEKFLLSSTETIQQ